MTKNPGQRSSSFFHPSSFIIHTFTALLCLAAAACAGEISVSLPGDLHATEAAAHARGVEKLSLKGAAADSKIVFANAQPGMVYDLRIRLADGRELRGADLHWYTLEPADPAARPLTDDDRQEMQEICNIPSFYDRSQILKLEGTHDRAAALMQLVRDRSFHAGGGEVIWRAEVWYFKFQAGGWEKVSQQTLLLDRQRFPTRAAYIKAVTPIRFLPALGGLSVSNEKPQLELRLTDADLAQSISPPTAATQPAR